MANIAETDQWVSVTRLEDADLVLGGADDSPSNRPLKDLTDRTAWMRARMATVMVMEVESPGADEYLDVELWDHDLGNYGAHVSQLGTPDGTLGDVGVERVSGGSVRIRNTGAPGLPLLLSVVMATPADPVEEV